MYSSFDYENLMAYKTSQYQKEAADFRLARLAQRAKRNSHTSPYDELLARLGHFLVSAGKVLQKRAEHSLSQEELVQPAH